MYLRKKGIKVVRVFTQMVSCHHEEALNYKFKYKRAHKSLNDAEWEDQWFTAAEYQSDCNQN